MKLRAVSSQLMLWSSSDNKDLKILVQVRLLSLLKLDGIQCGVFFDTHVCKADRIDVCFTASRKHIK